MQTLPLIEKANFEIVLDQLVTVLIEEEINQQAQAVLAGKDPANFSWRTVKEEYLPIQAMYAIGIPLVNVWYEASQYDGLSLKSNAIKNKATYNIDIYSQADTSQDGLTQGLTVAAGQLNRVIRQVFAILRSPKYNFNLGLPVRGVDPKLQKFIWIDIITSCNKFEPTNSTNSEENVIAARLTYEVLMIENIPDATGEPLLEYLNTVNLNDNGIDEVEILVNGVI